MMSTPCAAYIACLIKYPAKLLCLNLVRRVPARDQNDADQKQNETEGVQEQVERLCLRELEGDRDHR